MNLQPILPAKRASELTVKVARPLFWTDSRTPWPKRLSGATCFILRFRTGLVGVTADHVIAAFEHDKCAAQKIVAMLRTAPLDLAHVLIDRDSDLDLATFSVTEEQASESQASVVDCRDMWPPPMPRAGAAITFAGFPEAFREECTPTRSKFKAAASATWAEAVTDRRIVATYDPARGDYRLLAAPEFADLGANWSGCSGGPVLVHYEREGTHRWHAVGVIVRGPGGNPTGASNPFDQFLFQRLDFVTAGGTLKRSNLGCWLPTQGR